MKIMKSWKMSIIFTTKTIYFLSQLSHSFSRPKVQVKTPRNGKEHVNYDN